MNRSHRQRYYWSGVLSVVALLLIALLIVGVSSPATEGQPWHVITVALSFFGMIGCLVAAISLYLDEVA